jgi:hypothetical protein
VPRCHCRHRPSPTPPGDPPSPQADRLVLAQAASWLACPSGAGLPAERRDVRGAGDRVRRWHRDRLEIRYRDHRLAGRPVPGASTRVSAGVPPWTGSCTSGARGPLTPAAAAGRGWTGACFRSQTGAGRHDNRAVPRRRAPCRLGGWRRGLRRQSPPAFRRWARQPESVSAASAAHSTARSIVTRSARLARRNQRSRRVAGRRAQACSQESAATPGSRTRRCSACSCRAPRPRPGDGAVLVKVDTRANDDVVTTLRLHRTWPISGNDAPARSICVAAECRGWCGEA